MIFSIKRRLADRVFSQVIRLRDNNTCSRCKHSYPEKHKGLHASHFFSRRREATRFNLDNVDALCLACHRYWSHGEGRREYNAFKVKQLGKEKLQRLYELAQTKPYDDGEYIKYVRENDARIIKWCRAILADKKTDPLKVGVV